MSGGGELFFQAITICQCKLPFPFEHIDTSQFVNPGKEKQKIANSMSYSIHTFLSCLSLSLSLSFSLFGLICLIHTYKIYLLKNGFSGIFPSSIVCLIFLIILDSKKIVSWFKVYSCILVC